MAFLLDTSVVSELRKTSPDKRVLAWHQANLHADAYLSVLVVGELRAGIERVRIRDARRARLLEEWLAGLISGYTDRILPVTAEVADLWGRLNAVASPPSVISGLMAATAMAHHLTLVTGTVQGLSKIGVFIVNPFAR